MTNYLPLLRELTERLSDSPCPDSIMQKHVRWNVEKGNAEGFNLFVEDNKVAVMRADMAAGTVFRDHAHTEDEWVVVYMGKMISNVAGKKPKVLEPGGWDYIPAGTAHAVEAIENTKCIAISIPSSPGYPGVEVGK